MVFCFAWAAVGRLQSTLSAYAPPPCVSTVAVARLREKAHLENAEPNEAIGCAIF
jgi:hypothetical protein